MSIIETNGNGNINAILNGNDLFAAHNYYHYFLNVAFEDSSMRYRKLIPSNTGGSLEIARARLEEREREREREGFLVVYA